MQIEISVEKFIRLAGVPKRFAKTVPEIEYDLLKCVRIERKNNHVCAIATNRRIVAVYYLGEIAGADAVAHVTIDKALLKQCETEKPFNSSLHITAIPELDIVTIKTTMGYNYPGNAAVSVKSTPLDMWRTWLEPVTVSGSGAMAWHLDDMIALNNASPTGEVVFPEHIDAMKPIIIRDFTDENWIGGFMGRRINKSGTEGDTTPYVADPATLPTWWNA